MRRLALPVALLVAVSAHAAAPLPDELRGTGLHAVETMPFSPQYPLWSDGTRKQRWLHLPAGAAIDARRPDAWEFPSGTKAWKEFSTGRRIETRFIERLADGTWRFATYVWNAEGTEAHLAPAEGIRTFAVADAPGGRYAIPSRADCLACHEGAAAPLLGVSALQLSPERDPLAPHAESPGPEHVDLKRLASDGRIRNLAPELLASAPRIAAQTPLARAALGYLHGNCGHCHNDVGPLATTDLALAQQIADPRKSVARTLRTVTARTADVLRRVHSRNPYVRMPPLGTSAIDAEAVALIDRWIRNELSTPRQEHSQ